MSLGSIRGRGVAEAVIRIGWDLLPKKSRTYLTDKLILAQCRAEQEIPPSRVTVFAESAEMRARFKKYLPQALPTERERELKPCSLIMTCYNESSTINEFLDSILRQSAPPEEIVICDGGSSDQTPELVRSWYQSQKEPKFTLTLLEENGVSIAGGRNLAVAAASNEVLLFTDAGVMADRHWAERLRRPFAEQPETEVVMGWYKPLTTTPFARAISRYIVPRLEAVQPETFLPSARSLALKKSVFQAVGGYPEHLSRSGEDSLFDWYIKTVAKHFAFAPEAFCLWRVPTDVRSLFRTISGYAQGDAESGFLFWRYYLGLLYTGLKASIELTLSLLVFLSAMIFGSSILRLLGFVLSALALIRAARLISGYAPFAGAKGIKEKYFRAAAVGLMVVAQGYGFLRGYRLRRNAEQRRILKAERGHIVLLAADIPEYDPESQTIRTIQALLRGGWYVSVLYPLPKKSVNIFAHPQLEAYNRSAFRLDEWMAKHKGFLNLPGRKFLYLDLSEDGLSKELVVRLEQAGAGDYSRRAGDSPDGA